MQPDEQRAPRPWARAAAAVIVAVRDGLREASQPPLPAWWVRARDATVDATDRAVDAVCEWGEELRAAVRQRGNAAGRRDDEPPFAPELVATSPPHEEEPRR